MRSDNAKSGMQQAPARSLFRALGLTEEELRQFEAEQAAKRKRREEYARLNEESALKRKLMEQETDERYYQTSITKKAVSIAAYEVAGILK